MNEAKRQRTEAAEAGASGTEAAPPPPPHEKEPDKYISARDAVSLVFVGARDAAADTSSCVSHKPEYTHQVFTGESIAMPKAQRPFTIDVLYAASMLDHFIRCNRPLDGAVEDAMYTLADKFPDALPSEEALYESARSSPTADTCGPTVSTYTLGTSAGGATFDVRVAALHDNPAASRLCARLQTVMRWYIDGHSDIDHSEVIDEYRNARIAILINPILSDAGALASLHVMDPWP